MERRRLGLLSRTLGPQDLGGFVEIAATQQRARPAVGVNPLLGTLTNSLELGFVETSLICTPRITVARSLFMIPRLERLPKTAEAVYFRDEQTPLPADHSPPAKPS